MKLYSLSRSLYFKLKMVKLSDVTITCNEEDYFTSLINVLDKTVVVNFYSIKKHHRFYNNLKLLSFNKNFLGPKEQKK